MSKSKEIKYVEPADYFPKEIREMFFKDEKKKKPLRGKKARPDERPGTGGKTGTDGNAGTDDRTNNER